MDALAPFQCTPRIKPETAAELVKLSEEHGYQAAITVHVWVKCLDKEVTNEADAQTSIARLKEAISKTKRQEVRE
ncbi:MAG: hypothetical protein C4570_06540 [Ammonifex sp.]|jgi:hypothetical protein|nr:MAG: hypothetical protein C4570_06540 [Ammonifex sp.]